MGAFNSAVITTKGQALLAKAVLNTADLEFTKIAVSDTRLTGDLASKTGIGTIKQDAKIASVKRTNNSSVKVSASIANNDLTSGYYVRNIGLYAKDPDEGEILYSISVADESSATADWMPPYNGVGVSSLMIDLVTVVGNSDKVKVEVDPTAFATVAQIIEVNEHLTALDNTITTTTDKTLKGSVAGGLKINSVGGTTRKCTNLFDAPDKTLSGAGRLIDMHKLRTPLSAGTYTLSFRAKDYTHGSLFQLFIYNEQNETIIDDLALKVTEYNRVTFTVNKEYSIINVYTNSSSGGIFYNAMLNIGTEPLPYEPYFEDLRSVEINKIETHNKNLFDHTGANVNQVGLNFVSYGEYVKINGTKVAGKNVITLNNKEVVLPAGTYTISLTIVSGSIAATSNFDGIMCAINRSDYAQRSPGVFNVGETKSRSFTLDTDTLVSSFDLIASYNGEGTVFTDVVVACQLERNDTATDFTPYRENSITLSQPIVLDGIPVSSGGNTIDENGQRWLCNELDLEKKQFVKRVGCVDMGTLNWGYSDGDKRFFIIPSDMAEVNSDLIMRALCAEYLPISYNEFYTDLTRDKTICRYINYLFVRNLSYTDAATFKTAMSGVMLYYELAEPVITDISDLLSLADQISFHSLLAHDEVTHLLTDSKENPVIEVEYGTNKTGAHTLTGMLTAQRNELKLAELTTAVLALNQE